MTAAVEIRVCANPNCTTVLVKRPKESNVPFTRRRFCSIACTNGSGVTNRGNVPLDLGPRRCANADCRALLERRQGENSADWRSRRYCRASCYRPRTVPARPQLPARRWCGAPGCGLELKRRLGECGADFRKRRFCGRDCSNSAAGKPRLPAGTVVLREDRTDWSKAACRAAPNAAWWTDTGRDDDEEERLRDLAHRYCAPCPLRRLCEERGRAERFGLYGGVLWRSVGGQRVPLDLLAPVQSVVAS